jgi:hypothetical protein
MKYSMPILIYVIMCTGCTTAALSRHTLSQEKTPTDIRYQEVMNNLALIASDPFALPAYSSIYSGSAEVTDTAQVVSTSTIGAGVAGEVFSPQYTRAVLGNWTLDPINVPEKLEAIRCACQWAVYGRDFASKNGAEILDGPPELNPLGTNYYFYSSNGRRIWRHFGVAEKLAKLPEGWLRCGSLAEVPPKACYKAHYGKTWVWVMPEHTEYLADFTLVLQNIARVDSNSATLLIMQTNPSDFTFPTKSVIFPSCGDGPYSSITSAGVIAQVKMDRCGNLMPDKPYYPWRLENVGSDSSLRSQINAAGLH